jgi:hypothetical protein
VIVGLDVATRTYFSDASPVVVTGSGFTPASVVSVGGVAMGTTFNSSTTLTATFSAAAHFPGTALTRVASTHERAVTVATGALVSNAATYTLAIPSWAQLWARAEVANVAIATGVAQWDDVTANARHLAQATGANQPSFVANAGNGKASILWDGANDRLFTASYGIAQPDGFLIFGKGVTWTSNDYVLDGGTADCHVLRQYPTTPTLSLYAGLSAANNSDLAVNTLAYVNATFNGAASFIKVNNNAPVTANAGATNFAGGLSLGARSSGSNAANIELQEILHVSQLPSAAELANIRAYGTAFYGYP